MAIVIALVFISLMLVLGAVVFFLSRLRAGDFEHGERLALLPLAEDETHRPAGAAGDASKPIKEGGRLNGSRHGS